ncbi:MAG: metal ABC transporter ATP-binding protein [Chloroflexota bacterium]|nr:MAG: metal ABC transporter ATP-binding protein [Chloroflexota bacterium]
MSAETLVGLDAVSFSYNGEWILDAISVDIKRGDFLGIVGPNGSGKTTLLKTILGLLKPDRGVVYLFGQRLSQFRRWEKVGYVPQRSEYRTLRFPITAEEIVSMGRIGRSSVFFGFERDDKQAIEEALQVVGMGEHRKTLISHLSGGQQQRVLIAKALASRPELLILDEPTVGVDVETQGKFYELLRNLNRERGLTILLVSHDIDVVRKEVKSLAYLNRRLVYYGTTKEFMRQD